MSRSRRIKRAKVGDLIGIVTSRGIAIAHYTHQHNMFGSLLQILNYPSAEGVDLAQAANMPTIFSTFIVLNSLLRDEKGDIYIAGHAVIPEHRRHFPLFRSGVPGPGQSSIGDQWWLWDGAKEVRVGALSEAQKELSIRGIVSLPLLIERLEQSWHPREVQ